MFSYHTHGLNIYSTISLPELKTIPVSEIKAESFPDLKKEALEKDVEIQYGKIEYTSKNVLDEGIFRIASKYKITEKSIYLLWNDMDICEIYKGEKIIVNPHTGIEESFLRALILGPALGILLHQRGRLVLHASAINMDGGAVAFIGHNRMGKSTTTMAFNYNGYPLVGDDILSIEFKDRFPMAIPGFPRIKLWPESIELVGEDVEQFSRIHSQSNKRSYPINNFSDDILPLKRIYVLENSTDMGLKDINPQNALIELIRNSYCANIFQNSDQSSKLGDYAEIVKKVPLKTLNVEKNLDKIYELIKIVENDL